MLNTLHATLDGIGDDEAFRSFLSADLARIAAEQASLGHHRFSTEARLSWENALCAAGWTALSWPRRYGGLELSVARQTMVHEELALHRVPKGINGVGHGILGPTLLLHGNDQQRARFLPPLARNAEIWCQGYSEPDAGSDLASLRTSAQREGDGEGGHYRVRGRKVWTSAAQFSQWCFLLVRTAREGAKQAGISFLLVDMRSPGIEVRPIRQMTGEREFNELTFDDVMVPVENLVGEEGQGWRVAMAAAGYERATYFTPRVATMRHDLSRLIALAQRRQSPPVPSRDRRLVECLLDYRALRRHADTMLEEVTRQGEPGPAGSFIKLLWSETRQRMHELAMDYLGEDAMLGDDEALDWTDEYLWSRAETILAGTSEIQRNIIATKVLGLPRAKG